MFPTKANQTSCETFEEVGGVLVHWVHFGFAGSFFLIAAYISFFLFTKTQMAIPMTGEKLKRNRVYRACAFLIILSVVLIVLLPRVPGWNSKVKELSIPFYLETIALWAFGVSWLTKGEALYPDSKPDSD